MYQEIPIFWTSPMIISVSAKNTSNWNNHEEDQKSVLTYKFNLPMDIYSFQTPQYSIY